MFFRFVRQAIDTWLLTYFSMFPSAVRQANYIFQKNFCLLSAEQKKWQMTKPYNSLGLYLPFFLLRIFNTMAVQCRLRCRCVLKCDAFYALLFLLCFHGFAFNGFALPDRYYYLLSVHSSIILPLIFISLLGFLHHHLLYNFISNSLFHIFPFMFIKRNR